MPLCVHVVARASLLVVSAATLSAAGGTSRSHASEAQDLTAHLLGLRSTNAATFKVDGVLHAIKTVERQDRVDVVDLSSPAAPIVVGSAADEEGGFIVLGRPMGVATFHIAGKPYAIVAAYADSGVQLMDLSDPMAPRATGAATDESGGFTALGGATNVQTFSFADKVYAVIAARTDNAVQLIDVSDPAMPRAAGAATKGSMLDVDAGTTMIWVDNHVHITFADGRTASMSLAQSSQRLGESASYGPHRILQQNAPACNSFSAASSPQYSVTETNLEIAAFDVSAVCSAEASGTATVAVCSSANSEYQLSGCSPIVCTRPADIAGYTVTETQLNRVTGFAVAAVCATNYEGSTDQTGPVTITPCDFSGPYSLSGCSSIVCTRPADIAGYDVVDTNLDLSAGAFDVSVACADGYEGAPAVSACTTDGDYTLSGCSSIVCTRPADIAGYTDVVDTNLDLSAGAFDVSVGAGCATLYEGTPAVSACTTDGAYILSGCFPIVCTRPADIAGYTVTETQLNRVLGFDVTAACTDTRYEGIVSPCDVSGPYSIAACSDIICTQPDTTGYTVTETQLNRVTGFAVAAVCATNYEGSTDQTGPVTITPCDFSGPYSLSGCSSIVCTRPADIAGYDVVDTNLDLSAGAFDVSVACADGYEGAPAVSACTTDGDYTLSGCSSIVCTRPADIAGYDVVDTNLDLSAGAFDVSVACADGYVGTPAVSACTTDGDYTLSGCSIVCTRPAESSRDSPVSIARYAVTENNLDLGAGAFDVLVECEQNHYGSPSVESCTLSGPYSVAGCWPIVCTSASRSATIGYTVRELRLSRGFPYRAGQTGGFYVTATCSPGWVSDIDTVDSPDSCTSTQLTGGSVTTFDADRCSLVVSPDFGITQGSCSAIAPTSASCEYVPGLYSRSGIATVTQCGSHGTPYTLSGCKIVCTRPADLTGYVVLTEGELDTSIGFNVTATCDTNFAGTATTSCITSGPYTLSGCRPIVCTRPADISGYQTPTEMQLSLDLGFNVTTSCATNYEGTATATACITSGPYTLSGCQPIVCTRPADISGYVVTELELARAEGPHREGFAVVADCAVNFEPAEFAGSGDPVVVTPCASSGPYSLSGCVPVVCSTPAVSNGYITTETELSLVTGFDVSATCAANYEGIPAVTPCRTNVKSCSGTADAIATCIGNATVALITCDLDPSTDGTDRCPPGCDFSPPQGTCTGTATEVVATCTGTAFHVPATCTGTATNTAETCDLDSSTDGTAQCPEGCTYGAASTPICDLDASIGATCTATDAANADVCTAVIALDDDSACNAVEVEGTSVCTYTPTSVVLGIEACPAGCTIGTIACPIAGCTAQTCTGTAAEVDSCEADAYIPTCDLDPATDQTAVCPAGCKLGPYRPTCDLDALTDRTASCPEGCNQPNPIVPSCDLGDATSECPSGCADPSTYTLSGCKPVVCTTPPNLLGYLILAEHNLDLSYRPLNVTGVCAPNYEGTFEAIPCTTSGPYTLAGCEPIICSTPSDTFGYIVRREISLELGSSGLDVLAECDATKSQLTGSRSTPRVIPCATGGAEYSLGCCTLRECIKPSTDAGSVALPGYTGGNATELLALSNGSLLTAAALGAIRCAVGYGGLAEVRCDGGQFTFHGCAENQCAAVVFEPGVTSGYRDGCTEGLRLTTVTDPSCTRRCDEGYTMLSSDAGGAGGDTTISCAADALQDDAYEGGTLTCFENRCAPIILGPHVVSGDVNGCQPGQVLSTRTSSNCSVKCAAGFAPQGVLVETDNKLQWGATEQEVAQGRIRLEVGSAWVEAQTNPTLVRCPSNAENGTSTTGGVICRRIEPGPCRPRVCHCHGVATGIDAGMACDLDSSTDGTAECPIGCTDGRAGFSCIDLPGGGHTCNYLCAPDRFLKREDMGLMPLTDPRQGPETAFYSHAGDCMPR